MKILIYLAVVTVGLCGFQQPADAQSRGRSETRFGPARNIYKSNMRHPTVRAVQVALRRHGYNPGVITGEYVAETRVAIQRYQRDRGLRRTGKIDRTLLRSLGSR
jgi:peptidoglycan hydrolase-like protein with peptidoglycan-binding domain